MSDALVSVIIPSFKMGHFVGEALESVGVQTYPHWEVIVVDDAGPEDGTRAAVEAFAAKHPDHRIEYIRHETNQGVSVARRTAFEAARGEYIAFLDADDAFLPEKFAKYINVLEANSDCVLAHGRVSMICAKSLPIETENDFDQWDCNHVYDLWKSRNVLYNNRICNSSVVCRRGLVYAAYFPDNLKCQFEDWLLWLLLAEKGKFIYLSERLTLYRAHAESFTSKALASSKYFHAARVEMLLALLPRLKSRRKRDQALEHVVELLSGMLWMLSTLNGKRNFSLPRFRWSLARASMLSEVKRLASRLRQQIVGGS
jgi:glycosyltransferase involved in cell wall biosynthesis